MVKTDIVCVEMFSFVALPTWLSLYVALDIIISYMVKGFILFYHVSLSFSSDDPYHIYTSINVALQLSKFKSLGSSTKSPPFPFTSSVDKTSGKGIHVSMCRPCFYKADWTNMYKEYSNIIHSSNIPASKAPHIFQSGPVVP